MGLGVRREEVAEYGGHSVGVYTHSGQVAGHPRTTLIASHARGIPNEHVFLRKFRRADGIQVRGCLVQRHQRVLHIFGVGDPDEIGAVVVVDADVHDYDLLDQIEGRPQGTLLEDVVEYVVPSNVIWILVLGVLINRKRKICIDQLYTRKLVKIARPSTARCIRVAEVAAAYDIE